MNQHRAGESVQVQSSAASLIRSFCLRTAAVCLGGAMGVAVFAILAAAIIALGPSLRKSLNLSYDYRAGLIAGHDLYVTNTCGETLSGVKVSFEFQGENGTRRVERFWQDWPLGDERHIALPGGEVSNVQRIRIFGAADQGRIEAEVFTSQ